MDYEEKYKDLVKRLNKAREEKGVYTFNSVLDVVAPELKIDESEDERIRKEIIDFLELPHPQFVGKRGHEEWIAWLEKQGNQKPATWSEEDDKILKSIIINIENLQFSEDMREKYHHILNTNKSYYQIKIDWLESLKDRVQPQPKNEWSEEDEDILNTIINHFKVDIECTDEDDVIRWLKSLKERVQPQQKWSEEDKRILSGLSRLVKDCYLNGGYALPTDEYDEYKKWLKSLRPQSIWKPSDEQMEALKSSTYCQNEQMSKILFELYQDLKKL